MKTDLKSLITGEQAEWFFVCLFLVCLVLVCFCCFLFLLGFLSFVSLGGFSREYLLCGNLLINIYQGIQQFNHNMFKQRLSNNKTDKT